MSRLQTFLAIFAVIAAAIFVNLLVSTISPRADLTEDRTFTLSDGSLKIINKIEEPITLELYASRSDVKLRPYLESYSRRIEVLLREYVAASKGKIKLVLTDPKPDTKEEQRAQRYALSGMGALNGTAYLGLTAQQADTIKVINIFDPSREKFLEYDISKLITSAMRLDRPKLALISTLAITTGLPQGGQQEPGPADVLISELSQTYEVTALSNQSEELPKDTSVVLLIHPHNLSDKLAYSIDQFLLNGGSIFAAVDPLSRFQKYQQGGMPFQVSPMLAMGAASDPALLKAWGIFVDIEALTGDAEHSVAIRGSRGQPIQYPAAFSVSSESFAKDSMLVSSLREISFMEAGKISLISGAEKRLKMEPLIVLKNATSGSVATSIANAGPFEKTTASFAVNKDAKILAALFTGNFPSAFPLGAPTDNKKPAAPAKTIHLKESAKPGKLLVVADSDFLLDPFTVRQKQMNGQIVAEEINDNLKFVVSALESLGGSNDLVSLRAKGTSLRPFKVVANLEREAQIKYQSKLDQIEKSIEAANTKITEISKRSGGDLSKGLVITPELQKELERFQTEIEKLSEERRIIRRGLNEDVNSLGRRLQIINLLIGPAIAALFGLLYTLYRRRKSA